MSMSVCSTSPDTVSALQLAQISGAIKNNMMVIGTYFLALALCAALVIGMVIIMMGTIRTFRRMAGTPPTRLALSDDEIYQQDLDVNVAAESRRVHRHMSDLKTRYQAYNKEISQYIRDYRPGEEESEPVIDERIAVRQHDKFKYDSS